MIQINASIAKYQNRIWCSYRTRNLYQFDSLSYIAELNSEFEQVADRRLILENGNTAFEDVRLFQAGKSLYAFYTYFPFDGKGGWNWIYGVGMGKVDVEKGVIMEQHSLRSFSKRYHEKNWTPYVYDGAIYVITDFDPLLRVIKIGAIGEEIMPEEVFLSEAKSSKWNYGEIRGGTPLVLNPIDGLLYGFVHSYLPNINGFKRFYYYTALRFDHLLNSVDVYPNPMSYQDDDADEEYKDLWDISNGCSLKVIFPIGIISEGDGVMVSFGRDDVCSFTEYFSWSYLMNLFNENKLNL